MVKVENSKWQFHIPYLTLSERGCKKAPMGKNQNFKTQTLKARRDIKSLKFATTLSMMIFCVTTLSIKNFFVTLGINATQHKCHSALMTLSKNDTQHK
jgi:hypothetical protein